MLNQAETPASTMSKPLKLRSVRGLVVLAVLLAFSVYPPLSLGLRLLNQKLGLFPTSQTIHNFIIGGVDVPNRSVAVLSLLVVFLLFWFAAVLVLRARRNHKYNVGLRMSNAPQTDVSGEGEKTCDPTQTSEACRPENGRVIRRTLKNLMIDDRKQKRTRWVGDTVTIALLGATFYFVELIVVNAYLQRFYFSYTWDFKLKFLVFAIVLYCTLGILLGVLSALLLRSKRYLIAACPAMLVTIAHVFQFSKMVGGDLGKKWIEVISYILGLGTLYLLVAVLVAVGITFAKRRWDFTRSRQITIQVGLPLLAFGIGIYTGWGFGRVSQAVPDLMINTHYCLEHLQCIDDGDDARLRNSLEFKLDGIVRAIPIWRKAVLRPGIRKKMDATLVRIARYRQEHPKITGSGIGSEEQEPQLIEEWMQQQHKLRQAFDEQVASILQQALKSAPQVTGLTERNDEKGVLFKGTEDTDVQPSAGGDGIPPPQP